MNDSNNEIQSLIITDGKVEVATQGNFSTLETRRDDLSHEFLRKIFCRFEKQFNLRIISWQTWDTEQYGMKVLINHEPKEKVKVVHLPTFEPDIRL